MRARAEIVEAARDLFSRVGYQATTVEAIGYATGRSGAAVYQYFSGKIEIFTIFLSEVGDELRALADRFPLLTDDAAGRAVLRDWVLQLIDLYERHAGTFLSWSQVQFTEPELGMIGQRNLQAFQTRIAGRLTAAGLHPPALSLVPVGIMSVVQWSTFLNDRQARPVDRSDLATTLARILHAFLCAPAAALHTPDGEAELAGLPLPSIPLGDVLGLRRPVTPRGAGTVQRILLAAADRFRVNGYRGTSLNDVATRAGVSHGSVYTYWADREALFGTLARDAVDAIEVHRQQLPSRHDESNTIDGWVDGWVSMLEVHGSVLYVWQHEVDGLGPAQLTLRRDVALDGLVAELIALAPEAPPAPESMKVAIRALVTDVPYVLCTQLGILSRSASCRFVSGLLRAGLGVDRSAR